ncbi:AMP-binding protein, partial [Candidatus Bipolaricaulota bacterium]
MERITTILDTVSRRAESHPDAVAALTTDGQTITYRCLQRLMHQIAMELRAKHIGRTDRVVTVLPNGLPAAVGFLGTASRAIAVPLNPAFSRSDFVFCGGECSGVQFSVNEKALGVEVLETED